MTKEKLVTLDYLKKYDAHKTPPIQYVESLPTEKVENGIYAVNHSDIEIKTVEKTFPDLLTSYFKETVKGKWTTDYKVTIDDNVFMSAVVTGETVSIYKNPDWSSPYPYIYGTETVFTFTIKEESSHIDYYAGNATDNTFTKMANVNEVERYFIRKEEKGASNGVASLDVNGKVPVEQMPTEAFVYKGEWNPNSGAYPPNGKKTGDFYRVSADGTFDGIEWFINDWCIWNGDKWEKSFNHQDVNSVNGQKGVVVLNGENIPIAEQTEKTIKEYIDDITVDGEVKDENGNYTSKVVVEVDDLPAYIENRVYLKDNAVKTKYSDGGHFTKGMFFNISSNISPLKGIYKNDRDFFNNDYLVPLSDNNVITEIHVNNTVYHLDTTNGSYHVFDGGPNSGYTMPNKEIKLGFDDDSIILTFPTEGGQVIYNLHVNVTDDAYLVVEDITQTNTKEVYAKNVRLATYDSTVRTVNEIKPTDGNVDTLVELTKSEYETLVQQNKDKTNVVYAVTDEMSSVDIINDFQEAENLTWSSAKISRAIESATPVVFNDSVVSTTQGWTSNKIKNEIDAKSGIDDTTTSTTSSWSSNKINTEIATATTDMATQTWASNTFEPVNSDLLTKTKADTLYQPIGDYATKDDTNDMATQTWANQTFEQKNNDLLTKTEAGNTYQPKGSYLTEADISDMETKTHASQTYEPKNADLATKTWVGQQGYLTEHQSLDECVKHSEVYVQNGILYINL